VATQSHKERACPKVRKGAAMQAATEPMATAAAAAAVGVRMGMGCNAHIARA